MRSKSTRIIMAIMAVAMLASALSACGLIGSKGHVGGLGDVTVHNNGDPGLEAPAANTPGGDSGDNNDSSSTAPGATSPTGSTSPSGPANGGDGDQVWDGGELELYPAYLSVANGYSLYLDWNTAIPNQGIEWSSSDETVATVGADGLVTTVGRGEAAITAALIGKPEITAKCGIYVSESSANLDFDLDLDLHTPDDILIWEYGPPSIYYRMGVIGVESMSLDVEFVFGYGLNENIPICISTDNQELFGDETAAGGVSYNRQGTSAEFLSASRSTQKKPLRINKRKIRPKIIEINTWTILVKGDHLYYNGSHKDTSVLKGGPNGIKNNIYATFELSVSKRGGSSPVGSYGGTLEYTLDYDFSPHFAEHPDHSLCDDCWRGYKDLYTGEEYTGHYPGQPSGDTIITEWIVSRVWRYEGYYKGKRNPDVLFEITNNDKVSDNTYSDRPVFDMGFPKTREELIEMMKKIDFNPSVWFEINVDVAVHYTYYHDAPTNTGNRHEWDNGSDSVDDEDGINLIIYSDNTVRLFDNYTGTLAMRIG